MPIGQGAFGPLDWNNKVAERWRDDMGRLARCLNAYCKVGGLTMGASLGGLGLDDRPLPPSSRELADLLGPWYNFCIDAFGAERCLLESNFPMDKGQCSYTVLWNAFKRIAAERGCSGDEMAQLFGGTAKRVYRLA